jgi:hypothetical protein
VLEIAQSLVLPFRAQNLVVILLLGALKSAKERWGEQDYNTGEHFEDEMRHLFLSPSIMHCHCHFTSSTVSQALSAAWPL